MQGTHGHTRMTHPNDTVTGRQFLKSAPMSRATYHPEQVVRNWLPVPCTLLAGVQYKFMIPCARSDQNSYRSSRRRSSPTHFSFFSLPKRKPQIPDMRWWIVCLVPMEIPSCVWSPGTDDGPSGVRASETVSCHLVERLLLGWWLAICIPLVLNGNLSKFVLMLPFGQHLSFLTVGRSR